MSTVEHATGGPAALAAGDPVMAKLVEQLGELSLETRRRGLPKPDAYGALVRTIIAQQLSAKVAPRIHERVLGLFGGRVPSPQELLAVEPDALRGAGLSGRKVEYLRDLAAHVVAGDLDLDLLGELGDEEVIERISAVRGLGRWSAEMFLMFHLERPDVLPVGDLGIRRAVQLAYGLEDVPNPEELERIAEPWRPQRTLACIYLWASLHNTPV
jgi:DNA-3-methyladenine glycosylase II